MRKFRFDYSLKNIPIPSHDTYLKDLIDKVESVIKRIEGMHGMFRRPHQRI